MRRAILSATFVAGFCFLTVGALADPAGPATGASTAPAPASNSPDPNEVICHSEQQIGSLFPRRTCHTRREWDEMRRNSQDYIRDIQAHGGLLPPATAGGN